jgi:hypothetical protein
MEVNRLIKTLKVYDKVFSLNDVREANLGLRNDILSDPEIRPYDKRLFIGYLDQLGPEKEQKDSSPWTYALIGLLGAVGGFLARDAIQEFLENLAEDVNKKVLERLKYVGKK